MRLWHVTICAAMTLLLLGGCEKETPPPPPTVVTVSPVISGVITPRLQLIGQVMAQNTVDLVARVKGFLQKKNFNEGDLVKNGTVLYEIEPQQYQADLQTAQAEYEKALAVQKNADSDYARQESLYKGDAVSERVRDEALARKMEAAAQVLGAQAAIENAKLQLSYTKIPAPFDGRVGLVKYNLGNVVSAESGPLLTIVTIDPMDVEFSINEVALLKVKQTVGIDRPVDELVRVTLLFQDGTAYDLEGKITKRDNRVNPNTGMLKVKATFSNPKQILMDGMYVKVQLEPLKASGSLIIPRLAVQESQGAKYVMVVGKDNTVSRRFVQLGYNDDVFVQVKDGLKEGEIVVIEGMQKIRQNSKVAPKVDENYTSQEAAKSIYQVKAPPKISFDEPKTAKTDNITVETTGGTGK